MQLHTNLINEFFSSQAFENFMAMYYRKEIFASSSSLLGWRNFVSWEMILNILAAEHSDVWLPSFGKLPSDAELNSGKLNRTQALNGFRTGRTLLVRHSERAHSDLAKIALGFQSVFGGAIDIQLYCTPPHQEGFDWHIDKEQVFAIQSSGSKEFFLRKSLESDCEIRCLLHPGDWLYIPAGYWHKARAHQFSVHLSIGVLESN